MNKQKLLVTCKKRLPTICVILSAVTGAASLYFTGKATIKAVRKYDELKKENPDVDKKVVLKAVVPFYIPAAGFAATSLTFSIAGNTISAKRNRALALAAVSAQEALRDFKSKAKEVIGEEKVKEVEQKQAQDAKLISSKVPDADIVVYDVLTGFKTDTTLKTLYEAEATVNEALSESGWTRSWINLEEFYQRLGVSKNITKLPWEATHRWDAFHMMENYETNWVEFDHEEAFDTDGTPMILLRYFPEPISPRVIEEQMK